MPSLETIITTVNTRIGQLDPQDRPFLITNGKVRPSFQVVLGSKMTNGEQPIARPIPEWRNIYFSGRLAVQSLAYEEVSAELYSIVGRDDEQYGIEIPLKIANDFCGIALEAPGEYLTARMLDDPSHEAADSGKFLGDVDIAGLRATAREIGSVTYDALGIFSW